MPAEAEPEAAAPAAGPPEAGQPAPGGEPPAGGATADDEVAALRDEVSDYRGRWMRAVADYQNLRRRSAEERAELRAQLLAGLVGGYLGLLDDLDRALGSLDQHDELSGHPWVSGVELVRQKFGSLLEESGVREIAAEGEPFDPRRHEAIGRQPGPEGVVVAIAQRGYEAGSQVVRPARVVVGDGSPAAGEGRAAAAEPAGEPPAEPGAGDGPGARE